MSRGNFFRRKRNKKSNSNLFGKKGRSSRARNRQIETLEPRLALSVSPTDPIVYSADDVNAAIEADMQVAYDLEIDRAFQHVSDLSNYTDAQLAETNRWIIRAYDDTTSVEDLEAILGVGTISTIDLLENTYLYTKSILVETDDSISDYDAKFSKGGKGASTGKGQLVVTEDPIEITSEILIDSLSSFTDAEYFYPLVTLEREGFSLPNDPYAENQWHILNSGQDTGRPDNFTVYGVWGEDARITPVWGDGITGSGVIIGVIDDGMQYDHPDLFGNYNSTFDYDFRDLDSDPIAIAGDGDFHGTAVGGVAAAVGNNGIGVTGVAYNAEPSPPRP